LPEESRVKDFPIVALTAYTTTEVSKKGKKCGMKHVYAKPCEAEKLE